MEACGIVAEYNPFHNGHAWQLNQAKEKSSADVIVVAMSGNFLQRGEPAMVDKWNRSAMALAAGADIVVELPFAFAVQPADFFAKGAVSLLHALNCTSISFGVEDGGDEEYEKAGRWYHAHLSQIDAHMAKTKNEGASYPAQMERAMKELSPPFAFNLSSPNNQLGFAYARENALYDSPMKIRTVKRRGSRYHDANLSQGTTASATAIRRTLLEEHQQKEDALKSVAPYVPSSSLKILEQAPFARWEDYWSLLCYQLTVQSTDSLQEIYQMTEGLEYRMKKMAAESASFHAFLSRLKTKRYTWTRLQRLAAYTLLNVHERQMKDQMASLQAIRVLGFSQKGQKYLNQQKEALAVPLITNVNKKTKTLVQQDILAGEVYRLPFSDTLSRQDFGKQPVRFKRSEEKYL